MQQDKDSEKFAELMAATGEAFSKEPSPQKIEIYFRALSDLSLEQIERAVYHVIQTRTITGTFPLVAEIREAVSGKAEDASLIALGKIETAMSKIGAYKSIVFDDPIIHAVITRFGGWPKLCATPEAEWKFLRREIEHTYRVFSSSSSTQIDAPSCLPGIHEIENGAKGLDRPSQIEYSGNRRNGVRFIQNTVVKTPPGGPGSIIGAK